MRNSVIRDRVCDVRKGRKQLNHGLRKGRKQLNHGLRNNWTMAYVRGGNNWTMAYARGGNNWTMAYEYFSQITYKWHAAYAAIYAMHHIFMGLLANHLQSSPVSKPCFWQPKYLIETWPITSLDTFVHTTTHVNRDEETREKMAKTWGARRCHAHHFVILKISK